MGHEVLCVKLNKTADGLAKAPLPGALGERIYNEVSKAGWNMWLSHQTMLINEYRLSLIDPKAREFLRNECEKFFFGEGATVPSGYTPPSK